MIAFCSDVPFSSDDHLASKISGKDCIIMKENALDTT
jgi:hypothetical protein